MHKNDPTKRKPGRPERPPLEDVRTHVWAQAVCVAAHADPRRLEAILGLDGRWNGLWSRYVRGLVSPAPERVIRINKILPGTRRYFDSPFWILIENGDFTRSELRDCALWLDKLFQDLFIASPRAANSLFWRNAADPYTALNESLRLVGYAPYGLDALTSILLVIRESELLQDAWLYLAGLQAWASAAHLKQQHPILKHLPDRLFGIVAEPLRTMTFPSSETEDYWRDQLTQYCIHNKVTLKTLNVLAALVASDPTPTMLAHASRNAP